VSLQVDPELDNARTAIAWALQSSVKSDVVLAGRIVGGLRTLWVVSCKRNELRTLLEPLLTVLDEGEHPELVARLLKAATQVVERSDVSAYADRLLQFWSVSETMPHAPPSSHTLPSTFVVTGG
jgi:hypothetical protein